MTKPLISVIVPVYNVEEYLHTCVNSVLNQRYENWELILVNDGSTDNCPRICDEYIERDRRIKVIHKKNGGLSSARNAGLYIFKGDYVSFLDSDDFWHNDYLNILMDLSLKHDADIAQCSFIRGTETVFPNINNAAKVKTFDNHSVFLKGYAKIIVWAKLYKRKLMKGIIMPEGKINEDDFTTWKLYYGANKIAVTSQPLYYYTINEKSIMAGQKRLPRLDFIEAYEKRIDFFKKNGIEDLEVYSQTHFCKALILTSKNPKLTPEQQKIVKDAFMFNWVKIRGSKFVAFHLRFLFFTYYLAPKLTLRLIGLIR